MTWSEMEQPVRISGHSQVIGEAAAGAGDTATLFRPLADGSGLQLTFAKVLDAQQNLLGIRILPPVQARLDAKELARTGKDNVIERAAQ